MGTIYNRGPYQWQVKIRRDGHPVLSKTFTLRVDAEKWNRKAELMIERGEIDQLDKTTQKTTINEVLAIYRERRLPELAQGGRSKVALLARIENHFGSFFVASLRTPAINDWARQLKKEKLANGTINHHLNALSAVIDYGRRHLGVHIPENPVRLVDRPKADKPRDRRLSELELEWLLKAARQSDAVGLAELITLAVESSMRLGEMLGLEWSRVDFKGCFVRLLDTKNGESRSVALSSRAVAALQALPRRIDGRVFHWARADSFEHTWQRCVKRALSRYVDEFGQSPPGFLASLRFHDIRHESTSRLFEAGLNPMEVASMTGHKSMQMLKRYTHVEAAKLALKLG